MDLLIVLLVPKQKQRAAFALLRQFTTAQLIGAIFQPILLCVVHGPFSSSTP